MTTINLTHEEAIQIVSEFEANPGPLEGSALYRLAAARKMLRAARITVSVNGWLVTYTHVTNPGSWAVANGVPVCVSAYIDPAILLPGSESYLGQREIGMYATQEAAEEAARVWTETRGRELLTFRYARSVRRA